MAYDNNAQPQYGPTAQAPYYSPNQYGAAPQSPRPAPESPGRQPRWPWVVLGLSVLLFITVSGGIAYNRGLIFKDSGIKACEALRDGKSTFKGDPQKQTPMTEAQYRALRKVFEDSRYDDIRDHGTKLMDVVWQVSQLTKDDSSSMSLLAYLGPLTTQATGLQSACADQGIIVDLNLGK